MSRDVYSIQTRLDSVEEREFKVEAAKAGKTASDLATEILRKFLRDKEEAT